MPIDARQAQAIFAAAIELTDVSERAELLDRECGGDVELRRRVEILLAAHDDSAGLPAADPHGTGAFVPSAKPTELSPGTLFAGRYKIREKLGEGGMGTVYVADQTEPVQRRIALKIIKTDIPTDRLLARFEQERQALALMDHPNIAKVLDAGVADSIPYFAMELIKGVPITKYCDEAKLTPKQRLELFIPVCHAVQHAHQKGIIHRDLKPSNILIGLYDGRPVPKVIDFGVAKATGAKLTDQSVYTEVGSLIGTLEYMSPEQAELNNLDIDTRSDIYALGVVLYELLTGTVPHSRKELKSAGFAEMLRVIKEVEPPKPSTRLSGSGSLRSLAASRHTEPRRLTALLRNDLDWIVMKALEKDRSRRYETANGFAMDIQRYLADEPVLAGPPSAGYRLRKFVKRNKAQVIAGLLVLLALVSGIAGTTAGLIRAKFAVVAERKAKLEAEAEKKKAEQAEADTLADYRASTDDAIEQLISSKADLGPRETTYLEHTLRRWQAFAARQGDDERSRAIRAEGHSRVARLWQKLGAGRKRTEYHVARDLFNKLVDQFPAVPSYEQALANTHNNLGILLADLGKDEEARTEYWAARDLQKKLVDRFPAVAGYRADLANTHNSLALLLAVRGQREEARAEYLAARDLQKKLAEQYPAVSAYQQQLATIHNGLGALLVDLGKHEDARAEFLAARDHQKMLVEQFPTVPLYRQELARTHNNLGILLALLKRSDDARTEYQAARDLRKNLVEQFPAVPMYRQELARNHSSLAILFKELGKVEQARAEYQAARDIFEKLVELCPTVPAYQLALASLHNNLGILLKDLGKFKEARAEYQAARDLQKNLARQFPAVSAYRINLGSSYSNFGNLIRDEGKPAESLEWFDLAIQTLQPIHEKEPREARPFEFLRNSHWGRARAYDRIQKFAEAAKDWDRLIELSSPAEQPKYRASRVNSRLQAGMIAAAVADAADLTKSENWNAGQWYDFACVYAVASGKIADKKQEYADRAMELLQKAVTAGYKDAAHMKKDTDLDALRGREDFKKLLAELDKK